MLASLYFAGKSFLSGAYHMLMLLMCHCHTSKTAEAISKYACDMLNAMYIQYGV